MNSIIITHLFVPDFGGLATRAWGLMKLLASLGYDVLILTTDVHYPQGLMYLGASTHRYVAWKKRLTVYKFKTLFLPYTSILNRTTNIALFNKFVVHAMLNAHRVVEDGKNYDLIVVVGFNPITAFTVSRLLKLKKFNSKLIIDISDLWPDTIYHELNPITRIAIMTLGRFMNIKMSELARGLIFLNPNMRKIFVHRYPGTSRIPWTWIVNLPEESLFNTSNNAEYYYEFRNKMGIGYDDLVLIYHGIFGRLQGLKGIVETFTRYIEYIDKQNSALLKKKPLRMILVGKGEEYKEILDIIRNKPKANEFIRVLNPISREKVSKLIKMADFGLVPLTTSNLLSYTACPTKALEYLASGIPVVTPKGSFIAEQVIKSNAGFMVNFKDQQELLKLFYYIHTGLAEGIIDIEVMRKNATMLYRKQFSFNTHKQRLLEFLRNI